MEYHFNLIGDQIPNRGGEIHLEPVFIKEIFSEYQEDMELAGMKAVDEGRFGALWKHCFRHVKIREFKAVSGKCSTCEKLSFLRRTRKSATEREYITKMHALHRSA